MHWYNLFCGLLFVLGREGKPKIFVLCEILNHPFTLYTTISTNQRVPVTWHLDEGVGVIHVSAITSV
jgi:hypothetical protein